MSKKLLISFVPLLAAFAFTVAPTAAQAANRCARIAEEPLRFGPLGEKLNTGESTGSFETATCTDAKKLTGGKYVEVESGGKALTPLALERECAKVVAGEPSQWETVAPPACTGSTAKQKTGTSEYVRVYTSTSKGVPHWFAEGAESPAGSGLLPSVTWGTLSLKGEAEITCHNVIGGSYENPGEGSAGIDFIENFASYNCVSNFACPAGTRPGVEPQQLPWTTELALEKGKAVDVVKGVKVIIGCLIPPEDHVTGTAFVLGEGTTHEQHQDPFAPAGTNKGTSAHAPGKYTYGSESGGLEAEGSSGTVVGLTEGETKTLGYTAQEHTYAEL